MICRRALKDRVITPLGQGTIVKEDFPAYRTDFRGNRTASETSSWGKRWIVRLDIRKNFRHLGRYSNPAFLETELKDA